MQIIPTQLETEVFKTGNMPRVGIKISTFSKFFSAHQGFTSAGQGGVTYTSDITGAPQINISINHLGGVSKMGNMALKVLNQELFSDLFGDTNPSFTTYPNPEGTYVTAKLYFNDGTAIQEDEGVEFFSGLIANMPTISYNSVDFDIEATLTTMDNPLCKLVSETEYPTADPTAVNTYIPFVIGDMFFQRYSNTSAIWNKRDTYAFVPMVRINSTQYIISSHTLAHIERIWVYDNKRNRLMYADPLGYTITNTDSNGNALITFDSSVHRYIDLIDEITGVTTDTLDGGVTNDSSGHSGFSIGLNSNDGEYNLLDGGITSSATAITVDDGSIFSSGDVILIETGAKPFELMLVSNVNGNALTVSRGHDSSTARAHSSGEVLWWHGYNQAHPIQKDWWDYDSDGANTGKITNNNISDYDASTYISHTMYNNYYNAFDWSSGSGTESTLKIEFGEVAVPQDELATEVANSRKVKGLFYSEGGSNVPKSGIYTTGGAIGDNDVADQTRYQNAPVVFDLTSHTGTDMTVYLYHSKRASTTSDKTVKCAGVWWELSYDIDSDVVQFPMFASCLGLEYGTWTNDNSNKIKFGTATSSGGGSSHGANTFIGSSGITFANGDIGKWFKVVDNGDQFGIIRLVDTGTNTITLDRDWDPSIGVQAVGYLQDATYPIHQDYRKQEDSTGETVTAETVENDRTQMKITFDGGHRWETGDWIKIDATSAYGGLVFPYITKVKSVPAYNQIRISGYWTTIVNRSIERLPVITNPSGVMEGMLREITSLTASDFYHKTLNLCSTQLSDAVLGFNIRDGTTMTKFLDEIGKTIKTSISFDYTNKVKFNTFITTDSFPNSGTNTPGDKDKFTFTTTVTSGSFETHPIVENSLKVKKTGKLLTDVTVPYGKDYLHDSFNYQTSGTNSTVHTETISEVREHPFTYDSTTADIFRDHLLARRYKKLWELELKTFTNAIMFEPFDFINVQHPVINQLFIGSALKKWFITDLKYDFSKFEIHIKAREV